MCKYDSFEKIVYPYNTSVQHYLSMDCSKLSSTYIFLPSECTLFFSENVLLKNILLLFWFVCLQQMDTVIIIKTIMRCFVSQEICLKKDMIARKYVLSYTEC